MRLTSIPAYLLYLGSFSATYPRAGDASCISLTYCLSHFILPHLFPPYCYCVLDSPLALIGLVYNCSKPSVISWILDFIICSLSHFKYLFRYFQVAED